MVLYYKISAMGFVSATKGNMPEWLFAEASARPVLSRLAGHRIDTEARLKQNRTNKEACPM